jgi:hypothetical protein
MQKEVITAVQISTDGTDLLELDGQGITTLTRFGTRTAVTVLDLDQKDVLEQAFSVSLKPHRPHAVHTPLRARSLIVNSLQNPYLMHAILAVTAIHDRYQGASTAIAVPTRREAYHASQGASLLNQKLSGSIPPQDRDTLWMTATYLGIVAFCSNVAETPEESWPLKSRPQDLGWLRMTEAKMAIWELANPLQPGSLFQNMAKEYHNMYTPLPAAPIEGAPPALLHLCRIAGSSSATNNPYYTAVRTLAPLFHANSGKILRSQLLSFGTQMQVEFRALLRGRDPIALLILALWYEKAHSQIWWIWHRATVEYQAISLYLRQYHGDNRAIMELLA